MGKSTLTLSKQARRAEKASRRAEKQQRRNMSATTSQSQSQSQKAEEAQAIADAKKAMREAAQALVNFTVLDPFASCLITADQLQEAIAANYSEIYIWHNNQLFQHMQLIGNRHVRFKVDHLPSRFKEIEEHLRASIEEVKEDMNFLPGGKIPGEYWDQIVEFFRQVMKTKSGDMEAHAWILWEEAKGYYISIPKQVVSKASVSYTWDQESVPAGAIIVVDVHSHNTMGAFFSGTDNNDDKDKIYYTAVVGKITNTAYEWTMRFNLREKKIPAQLVEVFDMDKTVEIPGEWLEQVEVRTHSSGRSTFLPNNYIGGPKNTNSLPTTPGSSPNNPAKWTAYPTSQGGAGPRPGEYGGTSLWDVDDGPFGFEDVMGTNPSSETSGEEALKNAANDGGNNSSPRTQIGSKEEIQALLRDGPTELSQADVEEMDRRVTRWLNDHGWEEDGLTPKGEVKEVKGENIPAEHTVEELQRTGDKVADTFEVIDAMITDLENQDEALMDIATQCYHLMTEQGRMKLQTQGLN